MGVTTPLPHAPRSMAYDPARRKEGLLTKKGGIRRNWLERWFQLDRDDHELTYFGRNASSNLWIDKKGAIDTSTIIGVRESTAETATAAEIEIETPDRTYRLRAADVEERDSWIDALSIEMEALQVEAFGAEKAAQMRAITASHQSPAAAKKPVRAVGLNPAVDFVEWRDPVCKQTVRFEPCPESTFLTVSYDGADKSVLELLWFDLDWDCVDADECSKAIVRYYKHNSARFGRTRDDSKLGRDSPGAFTPNNDPERLQKVMALGALCKRMPSMEAPTLCSYTEGGSWHFPNDMCACDRVFPLLFGIVIEVVVISTLEFPYATPC
eukprot:COSAG01_NODE_10724_length_2095_cov_1.018036_2_plen_325_part_00